MGKNMRDAVRHHSRAKRTARAVLNVLADYADDDGFAWPSIKRLAHDTGFSERSVQRSLRNLVALGELCVIDATNGRGNTTKHQIIVATPSTVKGDNVTPINTPERVTNSPIKGDSYDIKGDNCDTERVTTTTLKGDNWTSSLYIEPNITVSKEPEVNRASAHAPAQTRAVVQVKSPHFTNQDFQNGYVPQGQGSNAVQVYYERFDICHNGARLSEPLEDDLIRNCADLDRLREVVTAYSQHQHYKPGNVSLIMDWYRDGIPTHRNGNGAAGTSARVNYGAGVTGNSFDNLEEKLRQKGYYGPLDDPEEALHGLPDLADSGRNDCHLPGALAGH